MAQVINTAPTEAVRGLEIGVDFSIIPEEDES